MPLASLGPAPPHPADGTEAASETSVRLRLLGLAFASADLLFELDARGRITFAAGAVEQITGLEAAAALGRAWSDLLDPGDTDAAAALVAATPPGRRSGPHPLRFASRGSRPGALASISLFRLPERPGDVSIAATLQAPAEPGERPAHAAAFLEVAQDFLGSCPEGGELDLLELGPAAPGVRAPGPESGQGEALVRALREASFRGRAAAEVSPDRFAVLRVEGSAEALRQRARELTGREVRGAAIPLVGRGAPVAETLRVLRVALDRFIEAGPQAAGEDFEAAMQRTLRETAQFRRTLAETDFQLAFQPIVGLETRAAHHFEALARFDEGAGPEGRIRLAEQLDLIADFDLAVTRAAVRRLTAPGCAALAVNLSARSLLQPGFVEQVLAATAQPAGLRSRLLLEVTESHAIVDLGAANRAIAALRRAGHPVCLDDFGAGAASLDYLRALEVDFVKIDGRFVRELRPGGRDALLLKHVVSLCRDLGAATIAEKIETEETARLVRRLGVQFGQGWYFGKPAPTPEWRPHLGLAAGGRRRGAGSPD